MNIKKISTIHINFIIRFNVSNRLKNLNGIYAYIIHYTISKKNIKKIIEQIY
jgi:hypothetical protein